jgi:hypothetical protein
VDMPFKRERIWKLMQKARTPIGIRQGKSSRRAK